MPITYSYEPSDNFALTRVTGSVFDSDPVDHLKSVLAHPSYRPGIAALVICQDVDLRRFSTQGIQRLVSFTREVERELLGATVAIVAPQNTVYSLVRIYQLLRKPPFELAVFRDTDAARNWLAVTAPSRSS